MRLFSLTERAIGVDFRSSEICAALVQRKSGGFELVKYARAPFDRSLSAGAQAAALLEDFPRHDPFVIVAPAYFQMKTQAFEDEFRDRFVALFEDLRKAGRPAAGAIAAEVAYGALARVDAEFGSADWLIIDVAAELTRVSAQGSGRIICSRSLRRISSEIGPELSLLAEHLRREHPDFKPTHAALMGDQIASAGSWLQSEWRLKPQRLPAQWSQELFGTETAFGAACASLELSSKYLLQCAKASVHGSRVVRAGAVWLSALSLACLVSLDVNLTARIRSAQIKRVQEIPVGQPQNLSVQTREDLLKLKAPLGDTIVPGQPAIEFLSRLAKDLSENHLQLDQISGSLSAVNISGTAADLESVHKMAAAVKNRLPSQVKVEILKTEHESPDSLHFQIRISSPGDSQ
jgi:hypothetical protein